MGKSLAPGAKGGVRLKVLQLHRLLQFQETFDKYLQGKVPASYVRLRAQKMLEVGLPSRLK